MTWERCNNSLTCCQGDLLAATILTTTWPTVSVHPGILLFYFSKLAEASTLQGPLKIFFFPIIPVIITVAILIPINPAVSTNKRQIGCEDYMGQNK